MQQTQGKKAIIELESLSQQLDLFEQFSPEEQEEFLVMTLQQLEQSAEYLGAMNKAWNTGDIRAMDALTNGNLQANSKLKRVHKLLLVNRNIEMAQQIEGLLKQRQTYFIVVGAGHLVGADGIVNRLQHKGYRIERL